MVIDFNLQFGLILIWQWTWTRRYVIDRHVIVVSPRQVHVSTKRIGFVHLNHRCLNRSMKPTKTHCKCIFAFFFINICMCLRNCHNEDDAIWSANGFALVSKGSNVCLWLVVRFNYMRSATPTKQSMELTLIQ